jgi:phosphatidylserine decarboxylase
VAARQYAYIAREGWLLVACCVVAAGIVFETAGIYWSLPFWLLCAVAMVVYRDPPRDIPTAPLGVVSPADGRVVSVETVNDPYLDRPAKRIEISMSPFGSYSTRSPIEGKVLECPSCPVDALPIDSRKLHGVWIQTDERDDLVLVMGRGRLDHAPRCYARIGERLGHGQRCGFIHFGGRIDVYLPTNSRVEVPPGTFVTAGADVIANLIHK